MRYELPSELTPEEERAIIAALDRYFGVEGERPSPWTMVGRAEALRLGALQIRHQVNVPWEAATVLPYTERWIIPRAGRTDTR